MTSDRDRGQAIPARASVGVVAVDDPASAAAGLAEGSGTAVVPIDDLAAAVATARVRLAEVVVDRARRRVTAPAGSPAVLAAEAHLRRALAGWKLHWWQRDEPVPELDASVRLPAGLPLTLVSVDLDGEVDAAALASMTATAPAAVRLVVLQPR